VARQLIGVQLEPDGPVVLAEIDPSDDAGLQEEAFARAADVTSRLETTSRSVQEALDAVVTPTARMVMNRLEALGPNNVELEFGLKISGKAGVVFASSEAEGHFTVKLSWQRPRSTADRGVQVPGRPAPERP
jgi:hypothetical protein